MCANVITWSKWNTKDCSVKGRWADSISLCALPHGRLPRNMLYSLGQLFEIMHLTDIRTESGTQTSLYAVRWF
jgi:hypothetical protein